MIKNLSVTLIYRLRKISLTLYNKEGKTTHTISQPMVDGDSIITGKDTVINETAYDINGNGLIKVPGTLRFHCLYNKGKILCRKNIKNYI